MRCYRSILGFVVTTTILLLSCESIVAATSSMRSAFSSCLTSSHLKSVCLSRFGFQSQNIREACRRSTSVRFPFKVLSSLSFENSNPPPEEDLEKWERMYQNNAPTSQFGESKDLETSATMLQSEVRVVTFDLDNTIWKTSAVISSANDALAKHLEASSIKAPTRVEIVMGQLFRKNKQKYCPDLKNIENDSGDGSSKVEGFGGAAPVLLTQLRKDAVRDILVDENGFDKERAIDFAEEAFQVWTDARHDAIPLNFAKSVIPCLENIRQIKTSDGHYVIVGAVTDGNSDPRNVEVLREYFDFCVNAETVGVSKPDKRVYNAAIEKIISKPQLKHIFDEVEEWNDDLVSDAMGPWWVHIGDNFIKDIVAAKDMKMRSIWCRELIIGEEESGSKRDSQSKDNQTMMQKKKNRDVSDLMKDLAEMNVVTMSIGADDFLLDSIQQEFADAIVDEFKDVSITLTRWHNEAIEAAMDKKQDSSNEGEKEVNQIPDNSTGVLPKEQKESESNSLVEGDDDALSSLSKSKFCVFCGTKLPIVAKFCSNCGNKQPEID